MDSLGALQHRTTDRAVARSLAAIGKLVADADGQVDRVGAVLVIDDRDWDGLGARRDGPSLALIPGQGGGGAGQNRIATPG